MAVFEDVQDNPIEPQPPAGTEDVSYSSISVGAGDRAFKANRSGIWLGANKFVDAPFSVDMDGNVILESVTIKNDGGDIILDGSGLNSPNNFYTDTASGGSFNTSSTTYVDVTDGDLSSLVLTRDTKVFVYIASLGYNDRLDNTDADFGDLAVYDSFISDRLQYFTIPFCGIEGTHFTGGGLNDSVTVFGQQIFLGMIFNLAAGTHNLKLQMKTRVGTSYISGFQVGLIKFGN